MDFTLNDDQSLLCDSVERFLDNRYDFGARSKIVAAGGYSAEIWAAFADLGWTGACLGEAEGGFGGSPVEAMLIMERFGRRLVVEPFVWTVVIGGQLLQALAADRQAAMVEQMVSGDLHIALATIERHSRYDLTAITTCAKPEGDGWQLDGVKAVVPNGAIADVFFVTAQTNVGVSLFIVERTAPGVNILPFQTQDGHNAAEVRFDAVALGPDALVGEVGGGIAIVERACDHGIAALCAEAVGSASYLIAATTAHMKQREQYGAPLAKLQVVQHRLAEMFVTTELARSMAVYAALSLDLSTDARKRALSAAKVQAMQSLRFVAQNAVQLHGGMGISEELDIAHHYKRMVTSAMLLGDETHHLNRFIALDTAGLAA